MCPLYLRKLQKGPVTTVHYRDQVGHEQGDNEFPRWIRSLAPAQPGVGKMEVQASGVEHSCWIQAVPGSLA